jgi:hypothetical protein
MSHPYRDLGARHSEPEDEPRLDRNTRLAELVVWSWSLLRLLVGLSHLAPGFECALAALIVTVVGRLSLSHWSHTSWISSISR